MEDKPETVLAWHFLRADRRLAYKPRRLVKPGSVMRVKPPLELCVRGLHASERAIDALGYAPGPIVCRVRCGGAMIRDADKLCAETREVLSMADATATLHEFACLCAEDALTTAKVEDRRCWEAIEIKQRWLKGEATDKELAAAGAAAWAAARAAQNRRLEDMLS